MNENDWLNENDLFNEPLPTLRRRNAVAPGERNNIFFDMRTNEIVHGNPDLSHWTNRDLVKVPSWRSGNCAPQFSFFSSRNNDNNDHSPRNLIPCA